MTGFEDLNAAADRVRSERQLAEEAAHAARAERQQRDQRVLERRAAQLDEAAAVGVRFRDWAVRNGIAPVEVPEVQPSRGLSRRRRMATKRWSLVTGTFPNPRAGEEGQWGTAPARLPLFDRRQCRRVTLRKPPSNPRPKLGRPEVVPIA